MGTGKTKKLIEQIPPNATVIALSFRRTFATDFAKKL